jgi:hypothetical protein
MRLKTYTLTKFRMEAMSSVALQPLENHHPDHQTPICRVHAAERDAFGSELWFGPATAFPNAGWKMQ